MKQYISLAQNIVRSNFSRLEFPYKLTFCITYWCNYKCKTCNIWQRRPKDELTLAEIQQFFQRSNKFNWIDFTGGEVWLRKDFVQIVEAAVRACPNLVMLHFPTNGYFTDRIVAGVKEIIKLKPPKFVVTISTDGDEAVNDFVRGKEGGWRRQMETYKQLHALPGVEVVLGMTLSALNADQYEKAFAAAKAECPWLKPHDFHLNVAHESGHYYGNEGSGILNKNKQQVIDEVRRYGKSRGIPLTPIAFLERSYLKKAEHYLSSGMTPMRCHALHSSCFVDSWGDVYPCGMYDAKVASLRDHDYNLETIWNLPRTAELQKEIWNYQCPQCWTPCEAYQSIFGNLLGRNNTKSVGTTGKPALKGAPESAAPEQPRPLVQIEAHTPPGK
jgi:MoaA/NifB/PqqE/SkfB family radical SAM enzyme